MPDTPCGSLPSCENLNGTVQVRRTIYGPIIVRDKRALPFGEFKLLGGTLRPYIDLIFETRWIPKGLCNGNATSIMSLAPSESVETGVRTVRRNSFSQLMSDSAESSTVSTHTRRQLTEDTRQTQTSSGGASGDGGSPFGLVEDVAGAALDLAPIAISLFGSIFDDIVGGVESVVEGVGGAVTGVVGDVAGALGGMLNNVLGAAGGGAGGGSSAVTDTHHQIDEIVDTVEHRESQSHTRQVVVSSSFEQEEYIKRTFSNPYRDRSLQLRFIPVFRHFHVVTTIRTAVCGLAMVSGNFQASNQKARGAASLSLQPKGRMSSAPSLTRSALAWAQVIHDDDQLRAPMVALLFRNFHTADQKRGASVERGLLWRAAQVRDNVLHVPAADSETLSKALKLNDGAAADLGKSFSLLSPEKLAGLTAQSTREVHLFAGTHVEAVAGECHLEGITTDSLPGTKVDGE